MRNSRAILLLILLLFYMSTHAVRDSRVTDYLPPTRIMWVSDCAVANAENLLLPFSGQTTVSGGSSCTLHHGGSVLLDFGKELHGGLRITTAIRPSQKPARVRIRFGESVSEAMSEPGVKGASNDHAMRDYELQLPWLGSIETGDTGFRFVRIDALDDMELPLRAVEAASRYRDIPYLGSFHSSDPRLDSIWATGARTVHLNMQNYLWDGIKRDRLVWVGDMHPEVMTINTVFGANDVVHRSLDLARDDTPLPGWMNGMCSYSLWWILIQRDLYKYQGDKAYLAEQLPYLQQLARQIIANTDGKKEKLAGATRFLDWPTSEDSDVIHSGLQALTIMSLGACAEMFTELEDVESAALCAAKAKEMRKYVPSDLGNKQAAAMLAIAGLGNAEEYAKTIASGGADGFSTFFGYYMLEALALAGEYDTAMDIISDYWGAMLDLGATSFWEDLKYSDIGKASRIDEFVPEGAYDIHADGGAYCYKGLRHSLCHGWASGSTAWLSRHVLGIEPVEPGFSKVKIEPHLGNLDWAEGSIPTPYGIISVSHKRSADGKINSKITVPDGVTIID